MCAGIPDRLVNLPTRSWVRKGDQLVGTGGQGSQHTDRTVTAAGHAREASPALSPGPSLRVPWQQGVTPCAPGASFSPAGGLKGATGPGPSGAFPPAPVPAQGVSPALGHSASSARRLSASSLCKVSFHWHSVRSADTWGPFPQYGAGQGFPSESASSDPSPSCQPGSAGAGGGVGGQ